MGQLQILPAEVLDKILGYLALVDLARVSVLCTSLHLAAQDALVRLDTVEWPGSLGRFAANQGLVYAAKHCTQVRRLSLPYANPRTEAFSELVDANPGIDTVEMPHLRAFDKHLLTRLPSARNLVHLDLEGCGLLRDTVRWFPAYFNRLLYECKSMQVLNLGGALFVDMDIGKFLPTSLVTLNLSSAVGSRPSYLQGVPGFRPPADYSDLCLWLMRIRFLEGLPSLSTLVPFDNLHKDQQLRLRNAHVPACNANDLAGYPYTYEGDEFDEVGFGNSIWREDLQGQFSLNCDLSLPLCQLSLANWRYFTSESAILLASTFKQLESLDLSGTMICPLGVSELARRLNKNSLGDLRLGRTRGDAVDDAALDMLIQHHGVSLRHLDLSEQAKVTNKGLLHLAKCENLEYFKLSRNSRITTCGLKNCLLAGPSTFSRVAIVRCQRAGEPALKKLQRELQHNKSINVVLDCEDML